MTVNRLTDELLENERLNDSLLPCPLCGGQASLYTYCENVDHSVGCRVCFFHKDAFNSDNEAIDAWNMRIENKELLELRRENEKLKSVLELGDTLSEVVGELPSVWLESFQAASCLQALLNYRKAREVGREES